MQAAPATTPDGDASRQLRVAELYRHCPAGDLAFGTTAEVADVDDIVGQDRAVQAIELAITTPSGGFNVFALGPPGIGKATAIRQFLTRRAATVPTPDDWCYVHNFADPRRPRALRLPGGRARPFARAMDELLEELRSAIPAAFESDSYRTRKAQIEAELKERGDKAFAAIQK
ncbi:MAG TPA: Lon-like protease helical domain-containing protein, partial [Candidatus Limnocylindrales bacterium]